MHNLSPCLAIILSITARSTECMYRQSFLAQNFGNTEIFVGAEILTGRYNYAFEGRSLPRTRSALFDNIRFLFFVVGFTATYKYVYS